MMDAGLEFLFYFLGESAERCSQRSDEFRARRSAVLREMNAMSVMSDILARALPDIWMPRFVLPARSTQPVARSRPVSADSAPARPRKTESPAASASEVREDWALTGTPEEVEGCRTLLLEIVRRAAYDWVLYRESVDPSKRVLADDAEAWLFEDGLAPPRIVPWQGADDADAEDEQGLDTDDGDAEEPHITRFLAICDTLDLDPEVLRNRVREMTPRDVVSVGRPAEYRRRKTQVDAVDEAPLAIGGSGGWNVVGAATGGFEALGDHFF